VLLILRRAVRLRRSPDLAWLVVVALFGDTLPVKR